MHLFDIRKIDSDNEKIQNCISCDETSTSMQIKESYEITLFYRVKKICLCNVCLDKFKATLNQMP